MRRPLRAIATILFLSAPGCGGSADQAPAPSGPAGGIQVQTDDASVTVSPGQVKIGTTQGDEVAVAPGSVEVKSSEGDRVTAGAGGVEISSSEGEKVSIGPGGVKISGAEGTLTVTPTGVQASSTKGEASSGSTAAGNGEAQRKSP